MANSSSAPLIGWRDAAVLAFLSAGYLVTAAVPFRFDQGTVERLSKLLFLLFPNRVEHLAARMQRLLGERLSDRDAKTLARDHYRLLVEMWWGRFRDLHGSGWQPEIEVAGEQRLRDALARGRGVVLWRMWFCDNPVFVKAFWRVGLPLTHLSNIHHGAPSKSRVGLRWLSPFYCHAENRYLAERVIIPQSGSLGYLKSLLDRLSGNACLSIVAENRARQNVTVSLFGHPLDLASGAPSLAWKSGAALLTAYATRQGPGQYRIVIQEPIPVVTDLSRKEFVKLAVAEFARRLERQIENHPADWHGWFRRSFRF